MTPENLVRLLQMTGAALAIPAAAAGTFAAYQSYFSSDVTVPETAQQHRRHHGKARRARDQA